MEKNLFSAIAVLSLLVVSQAASAQTATPNINARQRSEQRRIGNGVATGQLTPRETARLENREANIHQEKRAAKADGVVTRGERKDIRHDENKASRAIHRQKHDAQGR